MTLQEKVEAAAVEIAEETLNAYDQRQSRANAIEAAWAVHRIARMTEATGVRFAMPPRVSAAFRRFVA